VKKLLSLIALLFFTSLMYGQQTTYTQSYGPISSIVACTAAAGVSTSATISPCGGEGGMYQNSLVTVQTINWTAVATVSTCTLELEQSTTGTGSWTLLGTQQSCTSSGTYTVSAYAPYVRFNINSLTTVGNGSLTVNYFGQITTSKPQELLSSVINCGTSPGCSPSFVVGTFRIVYGQCTASSAVTCTVTGIAPAFTSASTYACAASDGTTAANGAFKITYSSSSSFVITTTSSSDAFNWMCWGT
jgi:hypothetical protein